MKIKRTTNEGTNELQKAQQLEKITLTVELPASMLQDAIQQAAEGIEARPAAAESKTQSGFVPLWAKRKDLKKIFTGLSDRRLDEYLAKGGVKRRKSDGKQGTAEYCVADIDRVYTNQSNGIRCRKVRT